MAEKNRNTDSWEITEDFLLIILHEGFRHTACVILNHIKMSRFSESEKPAEKEIS